MVFAGRLPMLNGKTNVRGLHGNELEVVGEHVKEDGTLSDFLESIQE